MKLIILNTREIKKLKQILLKQFGYALEKEYAYLQNQKKRVFLVNKDISRLNLENLRIDKMGLYLGELKENYFRLSKEGAQLLVLEGKSKVENVVELSKSQVTSYFEGKDLEINLGEESKLIILSYGTDILGCARYKEGKVLNFLPKIHRRTVIV
jgi:NOL1/NOP2/fmu family ribosome biogenesis protein